MYHYNSTIHTWYREQDSIKISCMNELVSRRLKVVVSMAQQISLLPGIRPQNQQKILPSKYLGYTVIKLSFKGVMRCL